MINEIKKHLQKVPTETTDDKIRFLKSVLFSLMRAWGNFGGIKYRGLDPYRKGLKAVFSPDADVVPIGDLVDFIDMAELTELYFNNDVSHAVIVLDELLKTPYEPPSDEQDHIRHLLIAIICSEDQRLEYSTMRLIYEAAATLQRLDNLKLSIDKTYPREKIRLVCNAYLDVVRSRTLGGNPSSPLSLRDLYNRVHKKTNIPPATVRRYLETAHITDFVLKQYRNHPRPTENKSP